MQRSMSRDHGLFGTELLYIVFQDLTDKICLGETIMKYAVVSDIHGDLSGALAFQKACEEIQPDRIDYDGVASPGVRLKGVQLSGSTKSSRPEKQVHLKCIYVE